MQLSQKKFTNKTNFEFGDDSHDEILEAIDARRKKQWFQWYGTIDFDNDPGKEIGKFQWLLDRKAITEEAFLETKNKIIEFHGLIAQQAPADDRTLN